MQKFVVGDSAEEFSSSFDGDIDGVIHNWFPELFGDCPPVFVQELEYSVAQLRVPLEQVGDDVEDPLAVVEGVLVALDAEVVAALFILVVLRLDVQLDDRVH